MNIEEREQMQKSIQEKYREIKRQNNNEDKTTGKKEAIVVAFAVFLIIILNVLFKGF